MAEPQLEDHYYLYQQQPLTSSSTTQSQTGKGSTPPTSQVIALATLVPLGATLLILAGLILAATVIGLALTTPLFVIFTPVLLPAALIIGLAVAGFLTSGAFGVTSLSSFAWLVSYLRRSPLLEQYVKPRPEDTVGHVTAQRTEEARDRLEGKAQETVQEAQSDAREAGKAQKENKTSS